MRASKYYLPCNSLNIGAGQCYYVVRCGVLVTLLSCEVPDSPLFLFIAMTVIYCFKSFFFSNAKCFDKSFGISIFVSRDTYKGKTAHIWISLNPAKVGLYWELLLYFLKKVINMCIKGYQEDVIHVQKGANTKILCP